MLKESENPSIIWPKDTSIADFTGTWWVAHTKSRNEKALAWQMQKRGISYFLPMAEKVARSRGRTIRSMLPLFSGYLFFCGNEDDRLEVLRTNRVANILVVGNQQRFLADLVPIEQVIRKGAKLQPHKFVKAGQKCRVIAGPLAGAEGIISRVSHSTRLVLQVEMLGQATSVEIDMEMIEPAE